MSATIKEARHKLGLSQQKMADLMGMSRPMVGKIELRTEGRKETKGHLAHLAALELLNEHGLIDKLASKLKED